MVKKFTLLRYSVFSGRIFCDAVISGLFVKAASEETAHEVYSHLDISTEVLEVKVAPKELEVGMQLRDDLYRGIGVLLLKHGTVFDGNTIEAVKRCFLIDPFEWDISVLLQCNEVE
jgi:hypothetical protein